MRKLLRPGLFARSFLLLNLLMVANLVIWSHAHRSMAIEPQAREIAQQIVTAVNTTRAALVYAAPIRRRYLLLDLATNEDIRIVQRDLGDRTHPLPDTALMQWVDREVKRRLGADTQIAWSVNDAPGIWVSLDIRNDNYWIKLDRSRAERETGSQWLGWFVASLLLSLAGAAVIGGFVNRPLTRLIRATRSLARGQMPEALPENRGADRIRDVYAAFNRMVRDLAQADADRSLMLAGLSHDLRTPVTRIRLELELLDLDPAARAGIESDLDQIRHILKQAMDFAQPQPGTPERLDITQVLQEWLPHERSVTEALGGELYHRLEPGLVARIDPGDLRRCLANLIDNARKYGHGPRQAAQIDIMANRQNGEVIIQVCDRGPGIPDDELHSVLRPFVRGNRARTDAEGAGLGMAIVQRLIQNAGGRIALQNRADGGLCVNVILPGIA